MITGNTAKKLNDREITTDTEKTTQATIGDSPNGPVGETQQTSRNSTIGPQTWKQHGTSKRNYTERQPPLKKLMFPHQPTRV